MSSSAVISNCHVIPFVLKNSTHDGTCQLDSHGNEEAREFRVQYPVQKREEDRDYMRRGGGGSDRK